MRWVLACFLGILADAPKFHLCRLSALGFRLLSLWLCRRSRHPAMRPTQRWDNVPSSPTPMLRKLLSLSLPLSPKVPPTALLSCSPQYVLTPPPLTSAM